MMPKVKKVRPLENYRLEVEFEDGSYGVVDIKESLYGPVFEPLKAPDFFQKAEVDEYGVICWPNGADLAPDSL
jgi:hypothetical protein